MDRNDIMAVFRDLARSQGLYGRIIEAIETCEPEQLEQFWEELEAQNFRNAVDVIMYIEC